MEKITYIQRRFGKVWGDQWSVTSEIGKLRSVLMHRPGKEIEGITDPSKIYFRDFIDVEKARWEHDQLAQVYRDHGIEVNYVEEMDPGCPNAMYCHDLILGTPEGHRHPAWHRNQTQGSEVCCPKGCGTGRAYRQNRPRQGHL